MSKVEDFLTIEKLKEWEEAIKKVGQGEYYYNQLEKCGKEADELKEELEKIVKEVDREKLQEFYDKVEREKSGWESSTLEQTKKDIFNANKVSWIALGISIIALIISIAS